MAMPPSGSSGASAHPGDPPRPAPRSKALRRALWIGLAVFCLTSVVLTQAVNRYAPGNPEEASAMNDQLEQRFGEGKVLRLEATMKDRVAALWSDELPATATIYVSGERADPASQAIYSCVFVRDDESWRLDDIKLVVDPSSGSQ